jgi:DNA mismatch repair protein MutS2
VDLKEVQKKLEFDKVCDKLKTYCCSQYGIDKVDEMELFTSPLLLKIEFNKLKSVKEFIEAGNDLNIEGLKDIRDDLERVKIPGNYIQPEKYNWIKDFLRISRIVKSQINSFQESDDLKKLAEGIYTDKVLEHNIESTIDVNGEVRDNASRELKKIREDLIDKRDSLRKLLSKLLKRVTEQEYTQDDIITLRDGRSVIPVKVENKRKVPGIIHSSSATGYTVFIEPAETIDLNNEITELHYEEKREVEKILRHLSEAIAKYYNELKVNADVLADLDFIIAKAKYGIEYDCIQPDISKEKIRFVNAFHPILIQKLEKPNVVPLNFAVDDGINTIVITGPNAGGKTVSLKTVGLLQMMFQSGILVPVSLDSEFKVFTRFFTVIGDEQSIENSLSSFSSHLKELKDVITNSDENSLILIDEICSGTDPKFGSALSASILKYLSDKNCFTIVTTHIGDLKIFAHNNEKFINASLEFNFDKLSPSFNFQIGIPGQSYTFELANKFNLPDGIIQFASTMVVEDQHKIEDMLRELNDSKIKYTELKNEYEDKTAKAKLLHEELESKLSTIKEKEKEIIRQAKEKATTILDEGRGLIEKAVKDVREKQKSISEIKKDFSEGSKAIAPETKLTDEEKVNLRVGDIVRIVDSNAVGEITEIHKDNVVINSNGLIIKSKTKKLVVVGANTSTKESDYKIILKEAFDTNLDIRGKYANEIEELLENFIYDGHINNIQTLSIVHGKGTGSLRKSVHGLLKRSKYVSSFRLGNWNEGDTGVTIVELKS